MRKIVAWIAPSIVWFGDEVVRRIVYWCAFIALVSAAMSWVASYITPISQYGWRAVVFAGIGMACIITLAASGALAAWRYFNPLEQSSISEREAPAPRSTTRICHVRSSVYFDKLEEDRLIRLVLEFLNASAEEIALESANGHLSYVGIKGISDKTLHPVTWPDERQPPRAKPFDDLPIEFHQSPPPESIQSLLEQAHSGKPFSIKFHLQIKAKVLGTGEIVEIRSWDGVSCQTKGLPVVTGRIVSLVGMSSR
jgi:hypothetical protein